MVTIGWLEGLVFVSTLSFAAHTILVKKGLSDTNPLSAAVVVLGTSMAFIWPIAMIIDGARILSSEALAVFAVSGIMAPGISRLLLYGGINYSGASLASVVYSSSPLFAALGAILYLKEDFTVPIALGTFSIIAGISITSYEGKKEKIMIRGVVITLVAAIIWGLASIFRKVGLTLAPMPVLGAAIASTTAFLPYLALMLSRRVRLKMERKAAPYIIGAGLCVVVSLTTLFTSIGAGRIVIVTPLTNLQPLFVICFTAVFLKGIEKITAKIVFGAVLAISGTILLASS